MPIFDYKARSSKGELLAGQLEASNEAGVADALRRRGVIPVQISEAKQATNFNIDLSSIFQRGVSLDEHVIFCRQMYALVKSGIPIIRAIVGLGENFGSPAMREALLDVAGQLEKGRTLSSAMNTHPAIFGRMMVSLIHVGENTGKLDETFLQLTEYFEMEQETRKRIKQATRYPMFVVLFVVAAIFILNIFVIPTFATMFEKFGTDLPWATQFLIGMSDFFVNYWWLVIAGISGSVYMFTQSIKTERGRLVWDRFKLSAPLIGSIINRSVLGRYARSFSMMLRAGVPLTTALTLVADAVDNAFMSERILAMRQGIERGESLLRTSSKSGLFTSLVMQMVAVGEETGRVDELLLEVAEYYEREVDYDLRNLTAKIEPVLTAIVSGLVLILALGIFTPMWDMMQAIKK